MVVLDCFCDEAIVVLCEGCVLWDFALLEDGDGAGALAAMAPVASANDNAPIARVMVAFMVCAPFRESRGTHSLDSP